MKIISQKKELRKCDHNKKNLGFVPTMGGIHKGHISLIKRSVRECDRTIVSIFINKQQFNKKSDFIKYPRNLMKDVTLLKKLKIDILYLPENKDIYPNGYNKKIKIHSFKKKLCGKYRPRHFEAIADVIDRFIKIINPSKIYLGKKDFQQLIILKDFIEKNHPKCKTVGCKTIREKDGIACSSRNFLLNNKERFVASKIFRFLRLNKNKITKKKISISKIKKTLYLMGVRKIDYVKILNINKLIKPFKKNINFRIFLAYYLGDTRLIDNI